MAKSRGLGKGLDELFGESSALENVTGLKISSIEPNPGQPRRNFDELALAELADSIRQSGVITPIAVRQTGDTYQIIAGERRWRASRMAGLTHIPAVVLDVDADTAFRFAMIENLQREDLNPIEEARGYQKLMDTFMLTQEQASLQVGRSRSAVANSLRLLALPATVRAMVENGDLSGGHARALLALPSADDMEKAARLIIRERLSVRQAEDLVKKLCKNKQEKKQSPDAMYIRDLQREMESVTGHKIAIAHGRKKGKLSIEYYGNSDLEKICEALKKL